jgi:hypothetical protein
MKKSTACLLSSALSVSPSASCHCACERRGLSGREAPQSVAAAPQALLLHHKLAEGKGVNAQRTRR